MAIRTRRSGTFHQERVGQTRSNGVITGALVVSFFVLAVAWFVFFSGHWDVSDLQIDGLQVISRGEAVSSTFEILDSGRWRPWGERNIFLIDTDDLAKKLKDRLFAENVTVEKSYPNVLRLMIEERQRSVVVASGSQLLNVDTDGVVTGETQGDDADKARLLLNRKALADATQKPLIAVDLSEMATDGYQVTDAPTIKTWMDAYRALEGAGIKFRYLSLMTTTSTAADIVSEAGYKVIIDLSEPLEPQIETYDKFIASMPKDMRIYEYADVRIPGKIFVK